MKFIFKEIQFRSIIKKLFNRQWIYNFFTGKGFYWMIFLSKIYKPEGFRYQIYRALSRKFKVLNTRYNYFYHKRNCTWNNERAVEIPIIWEIVNRYKNKEILEVGNVLSNYFNFNHDIIDKYEIADDVMNIDIVDYHPNKNYDLIISISTFEHIGWNEALKDPEKVLTAIDKMLKLLNRNGKVIITIPLGWNPYLDKLLEEKRIKFYNRICLKRVSQNNLWKEVKWNNIKNSKYNVPFPAANGLLILFIRNH